jgi:hypothetical protein
MRFDAHMATQLLDRSCGLEFHLQFDHDQAKAENALAGSARALLSTALLCVFAGWDGEATKLLGRAYAWFTEAIDTGEKPTQYYFPFATEAMNHEEAHLTYWLLHGTDSWDHLERSVALFDEYLASHPKMSLRSLSLSLPRYLDARCYQRVLDLLTAQNKWVIPKSDKSRWSELDAAYFLATSRLHGTPSSERLDRGLHKLIARVLNTWLLDGQEIFAARWIKIAYWNEKACALRPMDLLRSRLPAK